MSDRVYIGSRTGRIEMSPPLFPITQVVLLVDDETSYVSGSVTDENGNTIGRSLEAPCPYASQSLADYVLNLVRGFSYQPFAASDALIHPAAELGDTVIVGGVRSVLAASTITFDSLYTAEISAPSDQDVDHEYEYVSPEKREFNRKIARTYSLIEKTSTEIRTEVAQLDQTWRGNIEDFEAQFNQELQDLSGNIEVKFSNYSTTEQTAELIGTEVRSYLYVKDENGEITEQEKYSTTEQTAESISAAINGLDGKYLKVGIFADGMFVEDANGNYTQINGTKIQSETISGDKIIAGASISAPKISGGTITGGDISGGTITGAKLILGTPATDVTTLNDPAIHFVPKSDESPFGSIYYEYKASPSETESAHNLWITTREYKGIMATEPYGSIKIRSGYRMSLEAQVSIYINGGNQGTVFGGIVDFTNATVTGLAASSATAVFG